MDTVHHAVGAGARGGPITHSDEDCRVLVRLLGSASRRFRCRILAYCVLRTHYHLLIRASKEELSRLMHWVNLCYSRYYNRHHKGRGHVLEGPYWSQEVSGWRVLDCSRYIHLNGLDAIARWTEAEGYRWSSYGAYLGRRETGFIDLELLDHFDSAGHYRSFVEEGIPAFKRSRLYKVNAERQSRHWSGDSMRRLHYDFQTLINRFELIADSVPERLHDRVEWVAMYALAKRGFATYRQLGAIANISQTAVFKRTQTISKFDSPRFSGALDTWLGEVNAEKTLQR